MAKRGGGGMQHRCSRSGRLLSSSAALRTPSPRRGEGGVRGLGCARETPASEPPHPRSPRSSRGSLDLSPPPGRGEMISFSRRMRARAMPRHSQNRPAEQDRVTPQAAVGPAFGSIMPNKQKESGTPAGAFVSLEPHQADAAARSAERARLSAFHRGACCSEPTPQLSSRTRFLGPG